MTAWLSLINSAFVHRLAADASRGACPSRGVFVGVISGTMLESNPVI